jgi:aspartate/methionine/tyrosine aminotransferase
MRSRRLPPPQPPNSWSALLDQRRAAGAPLSDLTEANPTRVGLGGLDAAGLEALADPAALRYEPEPRGLESARAAVTGYYAERGLTLDPRDVVLTSGTSESYAHLFRLLADPGDTVLVSALGYPLFEPLAALEGVRLERYRLAWDGRWHLDLGSLERGIAGARALVLVQPNHPTGTCLAEDERSALEALCARHEVAIVSDEVFGDFPWPPGSAPLPSLLGEGGRLVPTFVLSGLSKPCGMPQLKLGWIALAGPAAARAEMRRGLEWIADLFLSVGTPVQRALPRLLEARHAYRARVRERLGVNLARLRAAVARHGEIELLEAAGGWVAVLRVPARRSDEEWALELLRRDVVVHPGHFYDFENGAFLVLSLIVPPETFARGVDRIEALAAEL